MKVSSFSFMLTAVATTVVPSAFAYDEANPYYGAKCIDEPYEQGEIVPDPPGGGFTGTSTCEPGFFGVGSTFGDPHVETYDDMEYNCMGMGDYILSKSNASDFAIHGRFARPDGETRTVSWTRGVAFLEGSPGIPSIEFSYAPYAEQNCRKFFVINGEDILLDPQSGVTSWTSTDGETTVTFYEEDNGLTWILSVTKDGIEMLNIDLLDRRQSGSCSSTLSIKMDQCYRKDELIMGVLGNNNGVPGDDWMNLDGSMVIRPASSAHDFKYCERWCMSNPDDSLFHYNAETVGTFEQISKCDVNANYDEAAYIASVPEDIRNLCLEQAHNFANCVVESTVGEPSEFFELESLLAQETADELKFIVCPPNDAQCETDWGQKEELVMESTTHPVICCASEDMSNYAGWSQEGSTWSYAACDQELNYRDAESFCRDQGIKDGVVDDTVAPRVCTAAEVLDAKVNPSYSCGGEFVWSSTGPGPEVIHQKLVACGQRGLEQCEAGLENRDAKAVDPDALYSVRCCADYAVPGWVKRCDHGYWNKPNIWSDSDITGLGCYARSTYNQAVQFCTFHGGRLCTYEEIYNGCSQNTGCGFNLDIVWTSTSTYSLP